MQRWQDELRLLLSFKLTQEHLVWELLPEMERVSQRLMSGSGNNAQGLCYSMGALCLGYLLMGDIERFEQAKDYLLRQEQGRQPLPIA